MGKLTLKNITADYLWASDVNFDGSRLEVYSERDGHLFDVSVPDEGAITINTFDRRSRQI